MPSDYYSRLLFGPTLAADGGRGGWSSAAAGGISSTPDKQARYITRHAQLLDSINRAALIQLLYADSTWQVFPAADSGPTCRYSSASV